MKEIIELLKYLRTIAWILTCWMIMDFLQHGQVLTRLENIEKAIERRE